MPTLVLLRHGQSQWNLENRFTGWWDVDLSDKGIEEARAAGALMLGKGLDFDCCFTSVLTRAIRTLHLVLHEMDRLWLPVTKDWRLNERHYGGLTGLNKAEMVARLLKLQDYESILAAIEGNPRRDPQLYFTAVFGEPGSRSPWACFSTRSSCARCWSPR